MIGIPKIVSLEESQKVKGTVVLYKNEIYKISKVVDGKANLIFTNNAVDSKKNEIPLEDLRIITIEVDAGMDVKSASFGTITKIYYPLNGKNWETVLKRKLLGKEVKIIIRYHVEVLKKFRNGEEDTTLVFYTNPTKDDIKEAAEDWGEYQNHSGHNYGYRLLWGETPVEYAHFDQENWNEIFIDYQKTVRGPFVLDSFLAYLKENFESPKRKD